jgi:hypothetical protein
MWMVANDRQREETKQCDERNVGGQETEKEITQDQENKKA